MSDIGKQRVIVPCILHRTIILESTSIDCMCWLAVNCARYIQHLLFIVMVLILILGNCFCMIASHLWSYMYLFFMFCFENEYLYKFRVYLWQTYELVIMYNVVMVVYNCCLRFASYSECYLMIRKPKVAFFTNSWKGD